MSRRLTVMTVLGTRPEAIKLAPVLLGFRDAHQLESRVAVTAQHREMLDQVLQLFQITPDYDLDMQRKRQSLTEITIRSLEGLEPILCDGVDLVVVQGDTTTSFAAALAAFYHHIPVVHVEAGLRTGDVTNPFPEELNRRLTTRLTSLHLAPTEQNVRNLLDEGVSQDSIVCTGNTVIDALSHVIALRPSYEEPLLDRLDDDTRRVVLVTVHRRESWGEVMEGIGRALARLADDPDLLLVFPIHKNPAVRTSLLPLLEDRENVIVVEPLGYGAMARLIDRCDLVLTDSGGIQEEAPSRGKPVLILRDTTERPETVDAGTAVLVGTDEDRIVDAARLVLSDDVVYGRMARAVSPYGDGRAARRTVDSILWFLGLGPRPEDFRPDTLAGSAGG